MNTHDEKCRNATVRALLKAKECLEIERMYLSVKQPAPMDELYKVHDSIDHVVNSLDRLTKNEEEVSHEEDIRNNLVGTSISGREISQL